MCILWSLWLRYLESYFNFSPFRPNRLQHHKNFIRGMAKAWNPVSTRIIEFKMTQRHFTSPMKWDLQYVALLGPDARWRFSSLRLVSFWTAEIAPFKSDMSRAILTESQKFSMHFFLPQSFQSSVDIGRLHPSTFLSLGIKSKKSLKLSTAVVQLGSK